MENNTYGISFDGNILALINPATGYATPIQFEEDGLPCIVAAALRKHLKGCDISVVRLGFPLTGNPGNSNPYREN